MFAALVPALTDGCGVHPLPDLVDRPHGAPIVARRIATAARDGLRRKPPAAELHGQNMAA